MVKQYFIENYEKISNFKLQSFFKIGTFKKSEDNYDIGFLISPNDISNHIDINYRKFTITKETYTTDKNYTNISFSFEGNSKIYFKKKIYFMDIFHEKIELNENVDLGFNKPLIKGKHYKNDIYVIHEDRFINFEVIDPIYISQFSFWLVEIEFKNYF